MSNMSYCRFENTARDLKDCYENMDDGDLEGDLSKYESKARKRIIRMCIDIAQDYCDEVGFDVDVTEWEKQ